MEFIRLGSKGIYLTAHYFFRCAGNWHQRENHYLAIDALLRLKSVWIKIIDPWRSRFRVWLWCLETLQKSWLPHAPRLHILPSAFLDIGDFPLPTNMYWMMTPSGVSEGMSPPQPYKGSLPSRLWAPVFGKSSVPFSNQSQSTVKIAVVSDTVVCQPSHQSSLPQTAQQ